MEVNNEDLLEYRLMVELTITGNAVTICVFGVCVERIVSVTSEVLS